MNSCFKKILVGGIVVLYGCLLEDCGRLCQVRALLMRLCGALSAAGAYDFVFVSAVYTSFGVKPWFATCHTKRRRRRRCRRAAKDD